jgi:O-antigen/teichoic acid export membrane protein
VSSARRRRSEAKDESEAVLTPPKRQTLISNTLAQSGPVFLAYAAAFVSAPIVLASIGLRAFGIWALTGALAQYGTLLDLGVGRAVSRFVALYDTNKDWQAIGDTLGTGLASVGFTVAIITGIAFGLSSVLAHAMHTSIHTMRILLACSVVMLGCSLLNSVLAGYPIGLRRMLRPNLALAVGALLNFVFSVVAVSISHSLTVYATANAAASLIGIPVMLTLVLTMQPRFHPRIPSWGNTKTLMAYAMKDQVVRLGTLINYQSDKVVIAFAVGPRAAGAYELANRVAAAALSVGFLTVGALVPTVTADMAARGSRVVNATYKRLTTRSCALSFPFLVLAGSLSPALLGAWLGRDPHHAALILTSLCVAYVSTASVGVTYSFAAAAGKPGGPAVVALGMSAINIALTVSLAGPFGVYGVLAGTIVALIVGSVWQVFLVHRQLHLPTRPYLAALGHPLGASLAAALPVAILAFAVGTADRVADLGICVVGGIWFAAAYSWYGTTRGLFPDRVVALLSRLPIRRRDTTLET